MNKISIVHWYPDLDNHNCGYCKNENTSASYGMWAEQLTVEDYQDLIDRGWRRSGMYCYKPIMDQTCCPQYTIRCNVLDFKLSKSQKKVIKKFNKYINEGELNTAERKLSSGKMDVDDALQPQDVRIDREKPATNFDISKLIRNEDTNDISFNNYESHNVSEENLSNDYLQKDKLDKGEPSRATPCKNLQKGLGADPNKPQCKKAKLLRLERKQKKLLEKGVNVQENPQNQQNKEKSLKEFLNDIPKEAKHDFDMRLIPATKLENEFDNVTQEEYNLYKKYQTIVHDDPPDKCNVMGFIKFLVSSPLKNVQLKVEDEIVRYGTFHQQYWIDDKLIAVAVLDILPRCVSSVYFFYDPDYRHLTLGTYGSLREIYIAQMLHDLSPSMTYYYMGFYIHTCKKMQYKGKLSESYLLCPETYHWFPIEKCILKLDVAKYSRLNDDIDALDENFCSQEDIDRIKICVYNRITVFGNCKELFDQEVFNTLGKLIGKKCASRLLVAC